MKTFDELRAMTPEELEQYRKAECEKIINDAPLRSHMRLRYLQAVCDRIHKTSTPLKACIKISSMMHESFSQLNDVLQEVTGNGKTKR